MNYIYGCTTISCVAEVDCFLLQSTEMHIYTDFLRLVLEILNAILSYALPRNPEVTPQKLMEDSIIGGIFSFILINFPLLLFNLYTLQFIYAIMHRQEVFQPFKNHPRFNELLENIYTVCFTRFYRMSLKGLCFRIFYNFVHFFSPVPVNIAIWQSDAGTYLLYFVILCRYQISSIAAQMLKEWMVIGQQRKCCKLLLITADLGVGRA